MYLLIADSEVSPSPFSCGNHKFVFCDCESVSVLEISSLVSCLFRLQTLVTSFDSCPFLTYFTHNDNL